MQVAMPAGYRQHAGQISMTARCFDVHESRGTCSWPTNTTAVVGHCMATTTSSSSQKQLPDATMAWTCRVQVLTGELPVFGAGLAGEVVVACVAALAKVSAFAPLAAAWVMAWAKLPAFPASIKRDVRARIHHATVLVKGLRACTGSPACSLTLHNLPGIL